MKNVKMLGLLVLCVVLVGSVQATPVVRNGDFEIPALAPGVSSTGDVVAWEQGPDNAGWRIYDSSVWGNGWTGGQVITNADSSGGQWGSIVQQALEADLTPSLVTEGMSLTFELDVSSQPGDFQADWFQIYLETTGGTRIGSSASVNIPTSGTWEHVILTVDANPGFVGQEYSYRLWNNWGGVKYDNISIVPEPATMALLGLGGLLLRRKR